MLALAILLRPNLHPLTEPLQRLLPVRQPLTRFGRSAVPGSRGTNELDRDLAHHLERHIELFRLLDGTTQVILRVEKESWCRHTGSVCQRRTFAVVACTFGVPGIAFGL